MDTLGAALAADPLRLIIAEAKSPAVPAYQCNAMNNEYLNYHNAYTPVWLLEWEAEKGKFMTLTKPPCPKNLCKVPE